MINCYLHSKLFKRKLILQTGVNFMIIIHRISPTIILFSRSQSDSNYSVSTNTNLTPIEMALPTKVCFDLSVLKLNRLTSRRKIQMFLCKVLFYSANFNYDRTYITVRTSASIDTSITTLQSRLQIIKSQ